eukprot:528769_1
MQQMQYSLVQNRTEHEQFIQFWLDHYNETACTGQKLQILEYYLQYSYEVMMDVTLKHFSVFMKLFTKMKLSEMHRHFFIKKWFVDQLHILTEESVKWHTNNESEWKLVQTAAKQFYHTCENMQLYKIEYKIINIIEKWKQDGYGKIAVALQVHMMQLRRSLKRLGFRDDEIQFWKAEYQETNSGRSRRQSQKQVSKFKYTVSPLFISQKESSIMHRLEE